MSAVPVPEHQKVRMATVWLGRCSSCYAGFLDLDAELMDQLPQTDVVYHSPTTTGLEYPRGVAVALVEGRVTTLDELRLVRQIRAHSAMVVSFGHCTPLHTAPGLGRQRAGQHHLSQATLSPVDLSPVTLSPIAPDDLRLARVAGDTTLQAPGALPDALPLYEVIPVEIYIPGCPPTLQRILSVVTALLGSEPATAWQEMDNFRTDFAEH